MILLFNKPFNVLTQFTDDTGRNTLKNYIDIPNIYVAGRLDMDSEGLLLLTDHGKLNHMLTDPSKQMYKTYVAQVEHDISEAQLQLLRNGVLLNDGLTLPALVHKIPTPNWLWNRNPPIRVRKQIPTSFIEISVQEGRNRQIRRMTAHVGCPTLRLIRTTIGNYHIQNLQPGEFKIISKTHWCNP